MKKLICKFCEKSDFLCQKSHIDSPKSTLKAVKIPGIGLVDAITQKPIKNETYKDLFCTSCERLFSLIESEFGRFKDTLNFRIVYTNLVNENNFDIIKIIGGREILAKIHLLGLYRRSEIENLNSNFLLKEVQDEIKNIIIHKRELNTVSLHTVLTYVENDKGTLASQVQKNPNNSNIWVYRHIMNANSNSCKPEKEIRQFLFQTSNNCSIGCLIHSDTLKLNKFNFSETDAVCIKTSHVYDKLTSSLQSFFL